MAKHKVAIIGGGPSGLSAAYHLSRTPELRDRFEVTVYQLGWRLGGKGATGRASAPDQGHRILEHGIHGFCGFYWNSLAMLDDCYRTLWGEGGSGALPTTMDAAFLPSSFAVVAENVDGEWQSHDQWLPTFGTEPPWRVDPDYSPRTVLLGLLKELWRRNRPGPVEALDHEDLIDPEVHGRRHSRRAEKFHVAVAGLSGRVEHLAEEALADEVEAVLALAAHVLAALEDPGSETIHRKVHYALTSLDWLCATTRGLLAKGEDGRRLLFGEIDQIDHLDYRDWLRDHGATTHTVNSAVAQPTAMILFPFPSGDTCRVPTISAATYAGWLCRNLCVAGTTFYFFAAGTGETVIKPLYQALVERDVRFGFFHRLERAETTAGPDGVPVVSRLHFLRQAQPTGGSFGYHPLVQPAGLDFEVWPDRPVLDRLDDAGDVEGVDLESWWAPNPASAQPWTAELGSDFDTVVWAIPPSTLPYVGGDLVADSRAFALAEAMDTTATFGFQIWLRDPVDRIGWDRSRFAGGYPTYRHAAATFPNPFNGVVDFSDLIGYEGWGDGDPPKGLLYFCGQLEDLEDPRDLDFSDEAVPALAGARLLGAAIQMLKGLGLVWPATRLPVNHRVDQQVFDVSLLHGPADLTGAERIAFQFRKANIDPPERYVQAPPGTTRFRMLSWETGIANLAAAGDWVYTGFNAGCFEGAVTGGALAAFAVAGTPTIDQIPGFDFLHPNARERSKGVTPIADR
jgi:uncharacterized protein with NAD-binding domain and iron-sulfur cluster